jgi:hypothetical protein
VFRHRSRPEPDGYCHPVRPLSVGRDAVVNKTTVPTQHPTGYASVAQPGIKRAVRRADLSLLPRRSHWVSAFSSFPARNDVVAGNSLHLQKRGRARYIVEVRARAAHVPREERDARSLHTCTGSREGIPAEARADYRERARLRRSAVPARGPFRTRFAGPKGTVGREHQPCRWCASGPMRTIVSP